MPVVPRSTPASLFSPCLGALGLGLAWRQAAIVLGVPEAIGGAVLAAGGLVTIACLAGYLVRLARRPGAILADLAPPPARGFPAAGTMCLMLLAAALVPHWPGAARGLWWAALALQGVVATLTAWVIWRGRDRGLAPMPVLYLPFAGVIAAPLAGVALGEVMLSAVLIYGAMLPAAAIAAVTLWRALSAPVPPAQRPAQMIHLAPLSLFGTGAALIGHPTTFLFFFLTALVAAALLLLRVRWMAAGGFGPAWGAFTFPLAAFAGLCLLAEARGPGLGALFFALPALAAASVVIPWILVRALAGWLRGGRVSGERAAA
ncbi:MAG: hypothetical protein D6686_09620 [Alphaproteobacteria bacterium]|nr:MAG: hypothetical protein D6686_09620 [Alphaproteobacteria bacterium]